MTLHKTLDRTSHADPQQAVVTHLDWSATVDFDQQILLAEATYTVQCPKKKEATTASTSTEPAATTVCLDTSHLRIQGVYSSSSSDPENSSAPIRTPLPFTLHPPTKNKPHLGQRLEITLPVVPVDDGTTQKDQSYRVSVLYQTTDRCSALQWLAPSQTAGKQYPYLFTQCQAIHARSLVPCQDCCGVKMTYQATVTVPEWATCVMSALHEDMTTTTSSSSGAKNKVYTWKQPVPISSYLLAMAVGELAKRDVSPRCAIWSEPAIVTAAAAEFENTEDFLTIAEALAGASYAWGRYDLLCLPNSFPYGGMENPCLTFVTPTLLAGDKSLADVVAHEIAHSWTGNLITNATWDHFWLNEGWTTWFQRKIMARHKGGNGHTDNAMKQVFDFDAIGGRTALLETIAYMPLQSTCLVLDIGDDDPDESYSKVAYEKGFTLLLTLERRVGSEKFEKFFQAYVQRFASQTLTSEDFKSFFLHHFQGNDAITGFDWDAWFYQPGVPPEMPELDQSMARASQQLAEHWMLVDAGTATATTNGSNAIEAWSSAQIVCFLDVLLQQASTTTSSGTRKKRALKQSTIQNLNACYHFAASQNAEILFRYCQLAIAAEDSSILPIAIRFITTQGRMKYVRPLYRTLYQSKMGRSLAISTFLEHQDFYHPICAKMVASDLKVTESSRTMTTTPTSLVLVGATLGIATVAVALWKRR
jgi:leukotriene-A4 hydrolase